jgi:NAD(P)-dependent dehydrogenase (short-subunit alcohol dehydrogenase family)
MQGRVCVVTGASSGIGKRTAIGLSRLGATVVAVCRDPARGEAAVAEIREKSGNADVSLALCDLSSQRSIRALAAQLKAERPAIHVLVNNAGLIIGQREVTDDGLERTFALNHLGYFLLTELLLDVLKASAPARIVNVASEAQRMGRLDFDDLQAERSYSPLRAYGQSKLANIVFTYELARRIEGTGITVNCVHPGPVATRFGETGSGWFRVMIKIVRPFLISEERGAQTPIWLASSPDVEGVTGKYFTKKKELRSSKESYDPEVARRLWEMSERLTAGSAQAER